MPGFLDSLSKIEILPNCIAARSSRTVRMGCRELIPIFCANCGADGGAILQTDFERVKNWAFYLCDPCAEKWSPLVDQAIVPDELFWSAVREASVELYGRELAIEEQVEVLKDENAPLTRLAKDRLLFHRNT